MVLTTAMSASAYAFDQYGVTHRCTTPEPADQEVFVYVNGNFGGNCVALGPGFYPDGDFSVPYGVPNDSISSLKVGASVRARLFVDSWYGGAYYYFGGGHDYGVMPSGWNDQTSSIRVETNSRSPVCNDLQVGEFALFRGANFTDDCVVLTYANTELYYTPDRMGIANDTVSSVNGGPRTSDCLHLFWDQYDGGPGFTVRSGTVISDLTPYGWNDQTSSLGSSTCQ